MDINIQNIAVVLIFLGAVYFLVRKFFFKAENKTNDGCGSGNCGC